MKGLNIERISNDGNKISVHSSADALSNNDIKKHLLMYLNHCGSSYHRNVSRTTSFLNPALPDYEFSEDLVKNCI